jgi:hypothetical protein
MGERKEQDLLRVVTIEVVHNCEYALVAAPQPSIDVFKERDPRLNRASRVGGGKGIACGRHEGTIDVTFAPATIVWLPLGPLMQLDESITSIGSR